jgi:hypothetical protein
MLYHSRHARCVHPTPVVAGLHTVCKSQDLATTAAVGDGERGSTSGRTQRGTSGPRPRGGARELPLLAEGLRRKEPRDAVKEGLDGVLVCWLRGWATARQRRSAQPTRR